MADTSSARTTNQVLAALPFLEWRRLEPHLELVELSPETIARLEPLFPPEASLRNPLDMIASAKAADYRIALDALLADANVDSAVAIFVPPLGIRAEEVAEAIVTVAKQYPAKPVLAVLMGREGLPAGKAELHRAGIPAYIFPESAARALGALRRHREWRARPVVQVRQLPTDRERAQRVLHAARGRRRLSELEVLAVLGAYGIPTAPARLAGDPEDAARVAAELGFPVALKIVSPQIIHKTEVGGVRTGIDTPMELKQACVEMLDGVGRAAPQATIEGCWSNGWSGAAGRRSSGSAANPPWAARDVRTGRHLCRGAGRRPVSGRPHRSVGRA
jgi:acetyltransferase